MNEQAAVTLGYIIFSTYPDCGSVVIAAKDDQAYTVTISTAGEAREVRSVDEWLSSREFQTARDTWYTSLIRLKA